MKWYGEIGFTEQVETQPGVWVDKIVKRNYYGDVLQESRTLQPTDQLNDDIKVSNRISIIADPYASTHFHKMLYVVYEGAKWKAGSVAVQRPRLIITLGGLYNG